MAKPIKMLFGMLSWVNPRNLVLDGVQIPHRKRQFSGERACPMTLWREPCYAKTAELIEMPFGLCTQVGPTKHVLHGVQIWDHPCERAIIRGKDIPGHAWRHSAMSCAEVAEAINLQFGLWTRVGWRKHKFSRIHQVAQVCPNGRAHWRHLANTFEPSICDGDAALCQITLTTCFLLLMMYPHVEHC